MTTLNSLNKTPFRERGATMLEFSLVIGVLLTLVLGLIDISRYFTARALLNKAATYALAKSQIEPDLQIDLRITAPTPAPSPYSRFLAARQRIQNNALNLATIAINAPSNIPAMTRLMQYQVWDPIMALPRPSYFSDFLILLPGQHAIIPSTGEIVYHPTLCAVGDGCPRDINAAMPFFDILQREPIYIEARAEFQPLLPILPARLPVRIQLTGLFQKVSSALYPPSRAIPPSVP